MRTIKILLLTLFVAALASCGKEEQGHDRSSIGDSPFAFEDTNLAENPTVTATGKGAGKKAYVIRSTAAKWEFVPQNEEDLAWAKVWPLTGSGDGIVHVTVSESRIFTARSASFEIIVDGQAQTTLFTVNQEAAIPRFSIKNVPDGMLEASMLGQTLGIELDTNLDYTVSVTDGSDWVRNTSSGASSFSLVADPLPESGIREREATITVTTPGYPQFTSSFTILQRNIRPITWTPFATWSFANLGATNEKGLLWISDQLIYSNEGQTAFMKYVKGPNTGIANPGHFDVSASNPRTNGVGREGDAWLFTIPVTNMGEEQLVRVTGSIRSSGGGTAWYYLQYSTDGETWTTVDPTQYEVKAGVTVPHTEGIRCQDGSANWPFEKVFTIPSRVANGFYYFRLLTTTDVTQNGGNLSATGSSRVVNDFSFDTGI